MSKSFVPVWFKCQKKKKSCGALLLYDCIKCVVWKSFLNVLLLEWLIERLYCIIFISDHTAKRLTCEHTSLNQLQREIKESINFAFTRSCNEGIVSYSFWAPQVQAALMLKKIAMWTTFPPRMAVGKAPGRGRSSPMAVAAAVESVLWRRATMATPNFAQRRGRKCPAPFCQRMPWCNLMRLSQDYSTNSSPRQGRSMPPCSWWQSKSTGRYLRGLAQQKKKPSFTLLRRLCDLSSSFQTPQRPTWQWGGLCQSTQTSPPTKRTSPTHFSMGSKRRSLLMLPFT